MVIGAGMGGLAAGLALAARGMGVTVLERGPAVGGKARRLVAGGRAVDAGPTVFTMRWVFEELFGQAGTSLEAEVTLTPAVILARHAWPDGSRLDIHADREATEAAIGAFAGPGEAAGYRDFARRTETAYRLFRDSFIAAQRPSLPGVVARIGLGRLPALVGVRPSHNMWREVGRHFRDPRLRQLFGRFATYCGSSPFRAPATLMLIAHVEQEGVWLVEGGIHALARRMGEMIAERGGEVRTGAHVARIETADGRVSGVVLADGERIAAEAVVFNGDAAALSAGLLGPAVAGATHRVAPERRSLSGMVWSTTAETRGFPLSHHTVFFGPDYRAEFDDMVDRRRLPRDPTTYVCAEDRDTVDGPAPEGPERLHIQINAPATGDAPGDVLNDREIARCREETMGLMERAGLTLGLTAENTVLTTPEGFGELFPGTGGALYGEATHGPFASFARPAARSRIPGLYLAGGSAHPGAGVPMAAMSGRLAAAALMEDRGST